MKKLLAIALTCAMAIPCVATRGPVQPLLLDDGGVETPGTVGDGHPDKPKVSVGKLDFYPTFESKSGLVTPRNVYVWLPDNYSKDKKYAVVYMSDGQNLFDAEKMFNHQEWRVDEVFDGLIAEGRIQDCIVVGVANSMRTRSQEYFPQDVYELYSPELKEYSASKRLGEKDLLGNNYLKFLVEELKPFIDSTYSTRRDRNHTFHMGSSMGGLISSYAVAKYPEVFGGAGCLSTHSVLYITNYDAEQEFIDPANQCYVDYLKANLKPNSCKIYMDRGDQTLDAQYPKYQDRIDRMFKDAGWDDAHYVSKVFPGLSHVEDSWASRLDVPVVYLLGEEPEKIRLYEGKAPGSENWTQQEFLFEYTTPMNPGEVGECILNVVDPELWAYLPAKGTETGAAVVVCPGGGFTALSWHQEGPNVAKWLAAHGIAAFVLKYRIAYSGADYEEAKYIADHSYGNQGRDARFRELSEKHAKIAEEQGYDRKMAWDDARVAITYIRKNAQKYGVNPKAIGIIGFSAGGNIVYHVALDHDEMSRPDFLGMIYPAWFEDKVPADPMPLFIAASTSEASSANGFGDTPALYNAWNKTRQPLEIHSFTRGFHGFGYRENGQSVNIWTTLFYNFLDNCNFLNK